MENLEVICSLREATGKGAARKLRQQGKIPGVLYGGGRPAVPVALDPKDIHRILASHAGENAIFQLTLEGEENRERKVILRELQFHPIRGHLIHVDFLEIAMDVELEVRVPVELEGQPVGVEKGGILTHLLHEVHVKCLPDKIPDRIVLDVSGLDIGDALHVSDMPPREGLTYLDDPETTVVHIAAPRVEVVVEEEEEEKPEEAAPEPASE
jgi:large subunit ribosomal protein L25